MADFSTLIASIEETIKTNGVQAITGQILQDEMLLMVSAINQLKQDTLEGYAFYGQVLADGGSASVTQNTFFLVGRGTYTINGNSVTIANAGVSVIVYDSVADSVTSAALFPYDDVPTEGSDNAVTSGAVAAALAEIPANFAACLYDRRSAGTPQSPYTFRQSGGDGVDYLKRIKGRTLVWNQLVQIPATSSTRTGQGLTITDNRDGTYTINGTSTSGAYFEFADTGSLYLNTGHKHFWACFLLSGTISGSAYVGDGYISDDVECGSAVILDAVRAARRLHIKAADGVVFTNAKIAPMCIDLTLLGWVPSSVSEFRAVYPLSYYSYTPALLINNAATDLESTGFNQWDEEWEVGVYNNATGAKDSATDKIRSKNAIPIFPNMTYYFNNTIFVYWYDADGSFISYQSVNNNTLTSPANAYFMRFRVTSAYGTTYNHDICINISDPSRNGTYEPYWKATRHLGLDSFEATDGENVITVNGLKSAGSVYDEIIEGKKYVKRIETRAYQSGDENNSAVTTDGTNTNYPLVTPEEYELVEPIQPMLEVDELGTERRLPEDTADAVNAPFESDSNYSVSVANLVRKLSE